MAFEYTPYRSPFVGAIADLIGQRGDIAAQQALNEAKVRSQAVSSVAQSLGNLAQYQADAPKRRLDQALLAEKQQQLADAQAGRTAARSFAAMAFDPNKGRFQPEGPSLETPTGVLPEQDGFTTITPDGVELFDKAKVGQRMAELGHGAWMLEHGGKIDELNKSLLETDARDKQTIRDAVSMWAGLPKELQQPGAHHIFKLISKRLSPEQAAVVQQQIDAGDMDGLMRMATPYLPKPETREVGNQIWERQPNGSWVIVAGSQPKTQPITDVQYKQSIDAAAAAINAGTATPEQVAAYEGYKARLAAESAGRPASIPSSLEALQTKYLVEGNAEAARKIGEEIVRQRSQIAAASRAPEKPETPKELRPLATLETRRIDEFNQSLAQLEQLNKGLSSAGSTGAMPKLAGSLPDFVTSLTGIGTSAKQRQALIEFTKQIVGKGLEGGVLRKEDEIKYARILPTLSDSNAVVKSKLQMLQTALTQGRSDYLELLAEAGRDVSRVSPTAPGITPTPSHSRAASPAVRRKPITVGGFIVETEPEK